MECRGSMGPGREFLQFLAILKLNKVLTLVLGSSLESLCHIGSSSQINGRVDYLNFESKASGLRHFREIPSNKSLISSAG